MFLMDNDSSPSKKQAGALWAAGGLVIGALAVFFAMRGVEASRSYDASRPAASQPAPDLKAPATTEPAPATEETIGETPTAGTPNAQPPPSASAPVLPPPSELHGAAPTGPLPTRGGTNPFQPPTPDAVIRAPEVRLVRLNVYTSGGDSARSELESFAQSLGAETRSFTDFGNLEREPAEGLLILVQDKHVEETVKFVQSRNSNVAEQSWRVTPQLRQSRLEDETQAALFALKARRQQLLIKYLDDADPVRDVEEAISKAEATLRRLRIAEAEQSLAAIKVTFGPRG